VFGFHGRKLGLDITYRRRESFQCVLEAITRKRTRAWKRRVRARTRDDGLKEWRGLQALRTAAVVVRRSDNGVEVTWSRDDSLATIPSDPDILAYCYVKDAREFNGTFSALEATFARGETSEPDRRIFVDFLARCVAMGLEDTVHGHCYPDA
jgi:hypothetical protein